MFLSFSITKCFEFSFVFHFFFEINAPELYPKNTKLNDRDEAVYIAKMLATRRHGAAGE